MVSCERLAEASCSLTIEWSVDGVGSARGKMLWIARHGVCPEAKSISAARLKGDFTRVLAGRYKAIQGFTSLYKAIQAYTRVFGDYKNEKIAQRVGVRHVLPRESAEEGLHFVGEVGGIGEGLADFFAEQFAVAAAKTMDGDTHRAFGHLEIRGDLRIRQGAFVRREKGLEVFEKLRLVRGKALVAQSGNDAFEERERPFAVVNAIGSQVVGGVKLVAGIGALPIERKHRQRAAAFLAAGLMPFVGQKVFEGSEQESTKPPFPGAKAIEIIAPKETGKETLRQVLGVLAGIAAAADVGVKRIPVVAAKLGECFVRLRRGAVAGGDNRRPVRRRKRVVRP